MKPILNLTRFAGTGFSVVGAVFDPVARHFAGFDGIAKPGVISATPQAKASRAALAARLTVRDAVDPAYPQLLQRFMVDRGSALSTLMKP